MNKADARDLSLVSLILEQYPPGSDFATKVTVAVVLFYNVNAAFHSIFKLGMFESIFHVVPRSTDAVSLLFSCTQFCRYAAPLAYNLLNLLPIVHRNGTKSVFEVQMNQQLPVLALNYMVFFPCIMPFYCACVGLNLFDRLVSCVGGARAAQLRFADDTDGLDDISRRGEGLLQREKDGVRNGLPIGDNHPSYSGRSAHALGAKGGGGSSSGLELNRFLKMGGNAAAAVANAASGRGNERRGLLSDVGLEGQTGGSLGAPASRQDRLKEALKEKARTRRVAHWHGPWRMHGTTPVA